MADRELERKRNNSILDEESQDSSEPASKKQRTSYDAYADVSLHGNLKPSQLGRGVDSGYVRCSLCPPSSKKTFARGRGLRTHMDSIHKPALNTEEEIKEWEETARNAVLESEKNVATQKWGSKNVSAQVVKDPDWLIFVKEGKLEELKKLVEGGWDPKSSKDKHGATAEHWAAGCGHLECLTYLISVGAEVKGSQSVPSSKRQKRRDGRTSLHWAARNGHLNVIEWMISSEGECGNDIDICTADGSTPLHFSCLGAHLPVMKLLIEAGADPKKTNSWGCGLTHWIAMSRLDKDNTVANDDAKEVDHAKSVLAVCDYLKDELGLDFSLPQKEGHTAAHKAAMRGLKTVVQWFISRKPKQKADDESSKCFSVEEWMKIGITDNAGRKPSDLAREAKENEIEKLLIEICW